MGQQRPKIVVLGSMCHLPVPGVVYQVLHYLLGLESLGFEAYYVEQHGLWVKNPDDEADGATEPRVPITRTMRDHGFADRWMCRASIGNGPRVFGGLPPDRLRSLFAGAEAILNVTGTHLIDDDMAQCGTRIYIETDPGIPQIRLINGDPKQADLVAGHTHHRTFGELVATAESKLPGKLPDIGVTYLPTRQPVLLDLWQGVQLDLAPGPAGTELTTIAGWVKRKAKKDIHFAGETYHWDKRQAFLPFIDLPKRSGASFCLALSRIDAEDLRMLTGNGWRVHDAMAECSSLAGYQRFIAGSRGEFTAAKDQYVRLCTGWFSDRSACYLAAGRPVITQDTGFTKCLPTGEGLLAFRTPDEAAACVEALRSNYARHAVAARDIAHEYFDARRVLTDLLHGCGVEVPGASSKPRGKPPRRQQVVQEASSS